jgi:hypothetical protein
LVTRENSFATIARIPRVANSGKEKKTPATKLARGLSLGRPREKKAKGRILDYDERALFFIFGLGLGLELLDMGKRLLWVFLGFIDAALAAQENRLILDQNLDRDPHGAEAVVGFDGAPLLGLSDFAIFFGQLSQIGPNGGFLVLRCHSPCENNQGAGGG